MNKLPLIGVAGSAGAGKDTVAAMIARLMNGICIAQADPLKRFAREVFDFTDDQLWGPSQSRNGADERYSSVEAWDVARTRLFNRGRTWINDCLLHSQTEPVTGRAQAWTALIDWFDRLAIDHGFLTNSLVIMGKYKPLTCRTVLQSLGTEYGRVNLSSTIWNRYAVNVGLGLLSGAITGYTRIDGPVEIGARRPDMVLITDLRFINEIYGIKQAGGIAVKINGIDEAGDIGGIAGHVSEAELKTIPELVYDYRILNDKRDGLKALEKVVTDLVDDIITTPYYSTGVSYVGR